MTTRAALLVGLLGCGSSASPVTAPPPLDNQVEPAVASALSAVALGGPLDSLEAYCASVVAATAPERRDEVRCQRAEQSEGGVGLAPFDELAPMIVSRPDDPGLQHCVIAVQSSGDWYVSAPSDDVCGDPGYVEDQQVRFTVVPGRDLVALQFELFWHTRDDDATAVYRQVALCGLSRERPACTPIFTAGCERGAPAGACSRTGYQLDWTVTGGNLVVDGEPALADDPQVGRLLGTHLLGL